MEFSLQVHYAKKYYVIRITEHDVIVVGGEESVRKNIEVLVQGAVRNGLVIVEPGHRRGRTSLNVMDNFRQFNDPRFLRALGRRLCQKFPGMVVDRDKSAAPKIDLRDRVRNRIARLAANPDFTPIAQKTLEVLDRVDDKKVAEIDLATQDIDQRV